MKRLLLLLIVLCCCDAAYGQVQSPQLPQLTPSISLPNTAAYTHATLCNTGCTYSTLAAALNAAACGTVISARAGQSEIAANVSTPNKACTEENWIIVASSDCNWQNLASCTHLPAPDPDTTHFGGRVSPPMAPYMYAVNTNCTNGSVIGDVGRDGSNHYRFIGLEVNLAAGGCNTGNVFGMYLGPGSTSPVASTRFIVDRCYIHSDPTHNSTTGIVITANNSAVIDSYISEIHIRPGVGGGDTQAILLPGQFSAGFLIQNNFLSSSNEVFMAGGNSPPFCSGVVTTGCGSAYDITFQYNYLYKNPSWNPNCSGQATCNGQSYGGISWSIKNHFELKAAKRLLVQGNVLDYDWYSGQQGECFQITPRYGNGESESRDNDLTIQYNMCRHAGQGINIAGADPDDPNWDTATMGMTTNRVLVQHNLFIDVQVPPWNINSSNEAAFLYVDTPADVQLLHNTFVNGGNSSAADSTSNVKLVSGKHVYYNPPNPPAPNCTFKDNIMQNGTQGWTVYDGPGLGEVGTAALNFVCNRTNAPWIFSHMAIIGGSRSKYPATTLTPANWAAVQFVNYRGPSWNVTDYQLQNSSPLHNAASDGTDVGANVKMVDGCTAGVIAGSPKGCPNSSSPR